MFKGLCHIITTESYSATSAEIQNVVLGGFFLSSQPTHLGDKDGYWNDGKGPPGVVYCIYCLFEK